MTPRELLALEPKWVSHDPYDALGHVPETDTWGLEVEKDERIETRGYAHIGFDDYRFWELGSVWFDGKPCLIYQQAGRAGKDHNERFIVDLEVYWDLVRYSYTLPRSTEADGLLRVYKMDEDMGDTLTTFYGNSLEQMQNYEPNR